VSSGDALLEGSGAEGGGLGVEAIGYLRAEAKLPEPPALTFEMPLVPEPPQTLQARVMTAAGEPLAHALIEVTPENPVDVPQIAFADFKGEARFLDLPPGNLRLTARAEGFATAAIGVPEDARTAITSMLSRGYRATVDIELPAIRDAYTVRVIDATGAAIEDLLDIASPRRVDAPAQLSPGPLASGSYVVELQNAEKRRSTPLSTVDRDVVVRIR
jgi:hypothetical protein